METNKKYSLTSNFKIEFWVKLFQIKAYFFFNSVRGVIPVIKNILKLRCVTEKDIKVICTDNDDNQRALDTLKGNWKPEKPLDKDQQGNIVVNNKTITFITKTCFEGVDYYSENPTTYIISDARNKKKHFVKTDIAIDIRQIAGRFRTSNPCLNKKLYSYGLVNMRVVGWQKKSMKLLCWKRLHKLLFNPTLLITTTPQPFNTHHINILY